MAGEGGGKARRNSQINGEGGGSIWFPIDARKLGNSCRNN